MADADRGNDDILGIFYTGGTTGFPKGVMLGYWNKPEATAEAIVDGWLYIVDRCQARAKS